MNPTSTHKKPAESGFNQQSWFSISSRRFSTDGGLQGIIRLAWIDIG
jgi:hypothetical protein